MIAVFVLGAALAAYLTVRAWGSVRHNISAGCALSGLGLLAALAALVVAIHLH